MKYFAFAIGLFAICTIALAQENDVLQMELEEEYYQRLNSSPDKSKIYIFFNNQPCPNCPQAIEMIEEVYNQNYLNNYELFLINYAEDTNSGFIEEYNLKGAGYWNLMRNFSQNWAYLGYRYNLTKPGTPLLTNRQIDGIIK